MGRILMHLFHRAKEFQLYLAGNEESVKDFSQWKGLIELCTFMLSQ